MKPKLPSHLLLGKDLSRRKFLEYMQYMSVGALLGPFGPLGEGPAPDRARLKSTVVHVRDDDATSWNFSSGWYGYSVDQAVVDEMVNQGLKRLTATATTSQAWSRLIPGYVTGEKIAIKVNFNNFSSTGPDPDSDINALIEPVNALIGTLVDFGFAPEEITVYDVTHGWHNGGIPQNSFINRCLYSGVNFEAYVGNSNPYSSREKVEFNCPPPPKPQIPDLAICNALVESDYLINMPIIKAHPFGYVTLAFKHHFGSVDACQQMHNYLPSYSYYEPDYSPMIDMYKNPHFGAKTVLTVGDGLFGHWYNVSGTPLRWLTFGNNAPSSLFFSSDSVAIDSVMSDLIDVERQAQGHGSLNAKARDYLVLAEQEKLGVHEAGDPWQSPAGSGYQKIRYLYLGP